MNLSVFPMINASLNTATAILLVLGFFLIRQKAITGHTVCMLGATLLSILFLGFYLYYHFHHGSTRFPGTGFIRVVYFMVLIPHTILAVVNVPLVAMTLFRAFKGQFDRHSVIARITLPVWLFVSVTGVIVYWMLYRVEYHA